MVQRTGGFRRKTRHKLSKCQREKGKIGLSKYFKQLNEGDKVKLKAEPAVQKGMYHPRFHGKVGVVQRKKGSCYEVLIKDDSMPKTLIVHPVHLMKA